MPFSTRRGGWFSRWFNNLLPISTKAKLPISRKTRKRTALMNFFFANVYKIALSVSLLFLLLTIFLFGIPNSFSSSFKSRHSPGLIQRRSSVRKPVSDLNPLGAVVDITTKKLHDKIHFLDEDGGPWKQGWNVLYKGDEWDGEKLKVFVVPHSHNDPGWKLTVEEYYESQSKHILDTIVETLSKDTRRKFIWEEMSYLERWWRDSSDEKRELFSNLVKNGQLEIVGGGWVMNDEANSHFYAIIEQITEGNLWLNNTIGFVAKNSWSIDPFGYSPTMAYLLRRMGFENMLIQRTHYEVKKELARSKNLEFVWRQIWDAEETTDIFVHMMPFYSYDIPHTCGPDPSICCQFDFARKHEFSYELCPWGKHPAEIKHDNVEERSLKLLDQYKKKSTLYRTNTLLVPLGDDFRYVSVEEAEAQFRNYQTLFDYINSDPSLNTEAKFGTLEDYFRTLHEETERINYSLPGEVGSGQVKGFPSLSGDFFTYADRQQDYWSGYYVSRPFFKAVDRVLEHTLRATEILLALLFSHCQKPQCEKIPSGFFYKLTAARRNLALFQHHDGVTGTAKDHVVQDYGNRMHISLQDLQIFMSKAIEVLLGLRNEKSQHNPAQFEPAEIRSKYDVEAVHKGISGREGTSQTVVFFNPLEQISEEVVMVVVNRPEVTVLTSNWTCVQSQVSPELQHDKHKIFTGRHRLHWKASVPPLGLQVYYVVNGFVGCEKAKAAKLKYFSKSKSFSCPSPYSCSLIESDTTEINNQHQILYFDVKLGLLQKISHIGGPEVFAGEEVAMYTSSGSGAYLFKPSGDAQPITEAHGQMIISQGPLMEEVFSYPKTKWESSPISHATRIYRGGNSVQEFLIEKEYHVELVTENFDDRELIVRYKTDLDNQRIFYSDLNGFQMSRRETYDKIPLQGNYYPMPALAFLQGSNGHRFSVHSRQSLGVASLKNGWLEIMLDRRLVKDDGRGLGQGVMDNRPMNVIFHILVESNISSSTSNPTSNHLPLIPSLVSHIVGAHLNYPLQSFIAKKPQDMSVKVPSYRSFHPLSTCLPCDMHIVNFKVPFPSKYPHEDSSRFVIMFQRRHWDSSYGGKGMSQCTSVVDEPVNLFNMFKGLTVSSAKATSLNLLHDDDNEQFGNVGGQDGDVLVSPMELQAYRLELRPH